MAATKTRDRDDTFEHFARAAKRRRRKGADRPPPIPESHRAAFLDRLEAAFVRQLLGVDFTAYTRLLAFLLPEEFRTSPPGALSPASQHPSGTPARIAAYQARAQAGEPIKRASDFDPVRDDRLAVELRLQSNGHGFRAIGWTRPPAPKPLPGGLYRDSRGKYFELE